MMHPEAEKLVQAGKLTRPDAEQRGIADLAGRTGHRDDLGVRGRAHVCTSNPSTCVA